MSFFTTGAIFIASLMYSVNLVDIGFTDNQRGSIACYVDAIDSCSNCNETIASLKEKAGCNETEIGILNDGEVPPDDCRIVSWQVIDIRILISFEFNLLLTIRNQNIVLKIVSWVGQRRCSDNYANTNETKCHSGFNISNVCTPILTFWICSSICYVSIWNRLCLTQQIMYM